MPMFSSATNLFRNLSKFACVAILAALIPSGIAQAGVTYNFVTDSADPDPFSGIPIYMEITDQAYADKVIDSWADVTKFYARTGYVTPSGPSPINIVIGPDDALSGSFLLGGMNDTVEMAESAGDWKGIYSTDAPFAPCNISKTCTFEGEWEIVAVPEPASIAIFGAGCLAAAFLGRRRRIVR
jgi:hypothetical protein